MKTMLLKIPDDLHMKLKLISVKNKVTMQSLVLDSIEKEVK